MPSSRTPALQRKQTTGRQANRGCGSSSREIWVQSTLGTRPPEEDEFRSE
ncbi:hypothetical protein HMPREF9154_0158 [Arachnia propionica F0230a]|nr:hypothetical protein HMPREF9154_0158 [Arachnia propionica F0230a]